MRWPSSGPDAGIFLAGMCWALLMFWSAVMLTTWFLGGARAW